MEQLPKGTALTVADWAEFTRLLLSIKQLAIGTDALQRLMEKVKGNAGRGAMGT